MKTVWFRALALLLPLLGMNGCMSMLLGAAHAAAEATHAHVASIQVSGGSVYLAGWRPAASSTVPCYWVDGVRTDLPAKGAGRAYAIHVSDGATYVAGTSGDIPCFWKNGARTDLSAKELGGDAAAICVVEQTTYVAGRIRHGGLQTSPCYWVNDKRVDLDDYGVASDIQVSDGTIYISGVKRGKACAWTNDVAVELPCSAPLACQGGSSIQVSGGTVYVAGSYESRSVAAMSLLGSKTVACFWTNGARTDLPGDRALAGGSCLDGDTFYVAGLVGETPCYWAGTARTDLPGGRGSASSIFVTQGAVYVAGNLANSACYWINGEKVDLP